MANPVAEDFIQNGTKMIWNRHFIISVINISLLIIDFDGSNAAKYLDGVNKGL